ncbi:SufS family cysteine desulfurase [Streptomyces acidiscabies]|uniref:cysteine desulfurase n=1 Tax=Streptomyces acidiscabies TaxID=42234 RepID=A0AAP6EI03_9ACTN|nr:SufS family cysteine desulfurase [Streptomyces acidiscabies]MBP5942092.1 SufS family cysteine desulfurase [Streptomyces sp. LBUM 1476]MBZ3913586.1 SufS family cysteine desulfurase [Streptomyces acidiscabies]MDX2963424.1 SufS family cysteine desulfurase [Streptomyces acidiscabies]MDX3023158.1 SufS family cysteine desulfurase [Streptomyces acidiscabies]MDX3792698.1 SufS family cysteine desulfurase [Streptomyces acidiscabies]
MRAAARYWLEQTASAPPAFPVAAVRADFPALSRTVRGRPLVWLDSAATAHKPHQVIEAVRVFYARHNSNVHRGAHTLAREATTLLEEARARIASFVGAPRAEEIVFVRGATEGINLVAQTCGRIRVQAGDEIVLTTLEHHANIVPWQMLCAQKGARLRVAPLHDDGTVDLTAYRALLGPRTRIVALAHVSNVLGTVLPVRAMADAAHAHGAVVVVDGAQAVPHLRVDVTALGADFYTLSGHKLFGPTGIGVLYGRTELLEEMPPWQGGGSMITSVSFEHTQYAAPPQKFEAGTGHIAGAVGLGAAVDYVQSVGLDAAHAYEAALVAYARRQLAAEVPGLRLLGPADGVGVTAFTIDGTDPARIADALDDAGIAVRAGHHCAQPVLRRYGLNAAVRPSFAFYNTREEVDLLVRELARARH